MVNHSNALTQSPGRPSLDQIWSWLGDVPDPEIPIVSVVDLGIVRNVSWSHEDEDLCLITVTPTYSGCPATEVIARQIREALAEHGMPHVRLQIQLSPPWTTDWLTAKAHENLREYGIAPPVGTPVPPDNGLAASLVVLGHGAESPILACPCCGSVNTEMISRFGSTPCKSLHRCIDCLEPFDHFKCH